MWGFATHSMMGRLSLVATDGMKTICRSSSPSLVGELLGAVHRHHLIGQLGRGANGLRSYILINC
jgi:hypothetical protein